MPFDGIAKGILPHLNNTADFEMQQTALRCHREGHFAAPHGSSGAVVPISSRGMGGTAPLEARAMLSNARLVPEAEVRLKGLLF